MATSTKCKGLTGQRDSVTEGSIASEVSFILGDFRKEMLAQMQLQFDNVREDIRGEVGKKWQTNWMPWK